MTKNQILNRMKKIEDERFFLSMKDCWNWNDYDTDRKLVTEWVTLKEKLKNF